MGNNSKYPPGKVSDLAELNPAVVLGELTADSEVSFIPMSDVAETGRWVVRQARALGEIRNGYTAFQEGDVLFAKITPCMENGKGCHAVGLVNGIGFGSTEFHVLRAKEDSDARFIFHITQFADLRLKASAKMVGSAGQQRVPTSFFSEYEVIKPEREEQARIADVLTCIDRAIEQTESLIAKQQRIKSGLMQDLLTRGVDEHGNIRSETTHEFKDSPLGRIPKEWEVTSLGDAGKWLSGGTPSKSQPRFWNGSIPWISSKDMKQFFLHESTDYVTEEGASRGTRVVPKDTILIVVRGMVLAHTFPVGLTTRETAFNQDLKACVCKPQVSPLYLAYTLLSNADSLLRLTTAATHGTKRFDTKDLFSFKFAMPEEKKEQDAIVKIIEACDSQLIVEKDKLGKLNAVKRGLMRDLLTGEVGVESLFAEPEVAECALP